MRGRCFCLCPDSRRTGSKPCGGNDGSGSAGKSARGTGPDPVSAGSLWQPGTLSPDSVKRIDEQTLARFPDAALSFALGLESRVKSTFLDYDRHYDSVLDRLARPDPNAVPPDIRKLIQDRIKERRAFAALP